MHTRKIKLPQGGTLEVECTDTFLDLVRKHFDLAPGSNVDDTYIRMFVWGACNDAVSKVEREIENESRSVGGTQGVR